MTDRRRGPTFYGIRSQRDSAQPKTNGRMSGMESRDVLACDVTIVGVERDVPIALGWGSSQCERVTAVLPSAL